HADNPTDPCCPPPPSPKQTVPPIQSPPRAPTPHSLSRLLTWPCTCDRHRGDTMPSTIARSMARPSKAEPAAECAIDSSQLLAKSVADLRGCCPGQNTGRRF